MRQHTPEAEWYIAQSDADWESLLRQRAQDSAYPVYRSLTLKCYGSSIVALLLLLAVAGGSIWHDNQAQLAPAGAEASVAAQPEAGTVAPRPALGWHETDLDATLWGPQRTLETASFVFHFHRNDAPAVIAVAAQVDKLYTTLRHNFGVPGAPGAEKLIIEVSQTKKPGQAPGWPVISTRMVVPSPALYPQTVEWTEAELLTQSIALYLTGYLLQQASEHHASGTSGPQLVSGLHLWQVWDLDLPLSIWREEVVQWLYADQWTIRPWQPALPQRYPALCAAHKLWMSSPVHIHIPLVCADEGRDEEYYTLWYGLTAPTRLNQLAFSHVADEDAVIAADMHDGNLHGHTVALATLVEYAVVTYGRQRLPAFVTDLGEHEGWEALIPAVFGVPASEFEADWQAYLVAHYGVSTDLFQIRVQP